MKIFILSKLERFKLRKKEAPSINMGLYKTMFCVEYRVVRAELIDLDM